MWKKGSLIPFHLVSILLVVWCVHFVIFENELLVTTLTNVTVFAECFNVFSPLLCGFLSLLQEAPGNLGGKVKVKLLVA